MWQLVPLNDQISKQVSNKCIAVRKVATPLRELTCHTVLPATRQRWHSRLYPSRIWYSIKQPQRDARLSWPRSVCQQSLYYTNCHAELVCFFPRGGQHQQKYVMNLLTEGWPLPNIKYTKLSWLEHKCQFKTTIHLGKSGLTENNLLICQ